MEDDDPLASVLPSLVDGLRASDDYEKVECLYQLAQIVDSAYGDEAISVCAFLREHRGIENIVELVKHSDEWLHQTALLVLGNLATDAVDPRADETRAQLKATGGFESLLQHLFSTNTLTVTYALGAIRNTCAEPDYVLLMQQKGVVRRLQVLITPHATPLHALPRNIPPHDISPHDTYISPHDTTQRLSSPRHAIAMLRRRHCRRRRHNLS